MKGAVLFLCLLLVAVCIAAPASAFVDRNGVTSAAQFKDYLPVSYLSKAGITDSMTVDQALDAYITYALGFSSPTAYAYIAQLSNPSQVSINAGGSTASASRGDVVAEGWTIKAGNGASFAIRYPGGVTHTIIGPYTYSVPAYGAWSSSATFSGSAPAAATSVPAKTVTTTVATTSSTVAALPDTSGYTKITKEVECYSPAQQTIHVLYPKGNVYAFTTNTRYSMYKPEVITGSMYVSDYHTIITGPGSSAQIEYGLDSYNLKEMSVFSLSATSGEECFADTGHAPTIIDMLKVKINEIGKFLGLMPRDDYPDTPTAVAGVRG